MRGAERLDKKAAHALAVEKLARVGLGPETADLFPAELSGGMQKRAGLARAIATNPSVLFFDEPTTGLDPIMARAINDLIRDIVRETNALIREVVSELGATAVTITHDMRTVKEVGDTVAMLHEGRFYWQGAATDALKSADPVLRQFTQGRTEGPIPTLR